MTELKFTGEDVWQDREIRFDVDHRMLRLAPGEVQIDRMDNVEDTKGNNGDKRIRGTTCEAIFVLAKATNSTTKFEFVFTGTTTTAHSKLFNTIASINRSYETTKLYREIKMRGAIIDDNSNLKLLPLEQLIDRISGVWNLSSEQGNLGVFVITNCRVVWFAELNILYNVSIPYLTLYSCRVRESKFGLALVLETTSSSGEYILGFRIDPQERLNQICKAIQAMLKSHLQKPIFGVTFKKDRPSSPNEISKAEALDHLEDDVEIDQRQLRTDAFAAYFNGDEAYSSPNDEKRYPVFSEQLGLAIEPLREGFTIDDLWNVHAE